MDKVLNVYLLNQLLYYCYWEVRIWCTFEYFFKNNFSLKREVIMWCFTQSIIIGFLCFPYDYVPSQYIAFAMPYRSWDKPQQSMVTSHKWQNFRRTELELKMVSWHGLGEEITSLTSPRGVILPGGAFRQHLQTRPVQLAGEQQTCFMGSGLDGVREVGT